VCRQFNSGPDHLGKEPESQASQDFRTILEEIIMPTRRLSSDEIGQRGGAIYDSKLRAVLEPQFHGQFVSPFDRVYWRFRAKCRSTVAAALVRAFFRPAAGGMVKSVGVGNRYRRAVEAQIRTRRLTPPAARLVVAAGRAKLSESEQAAHKSTRSC